MLQHKLQKEEDSINDQKIKKKHRGDAKIKLRMNHTLGPVVVDGQDAPVFDPANDRILIFTQGKTGSSTLQTSFGKIMQPANWLPYCSELQVDYPPHMKTHSAVVAADFLQNVPDGTTVWILNPVRHIYTRAISEYFQSVSHMCDDGKDEKCSEALTATEFVNAFDHHHTQGSNWLTKSFKDAIGVDLLQPKFNQRQGKLFLESSLANRKIYTVVLRLEDANRWQSILQRMFPGFRTINQNVGGERWYAEIYAQFKAAFRYTQHDLSVMNRVDDSTHFYSKEEQALFRRNAETDGEGFKTWLSLLGGF